MKNSFLFDHFPILTLLTQMSVQQTKLQMQTFAKTVLQGRFLMLCRISLHVLPVIQRRSLTTAHVKHVQKDKFQTPIKQSVKLHLHKHLFHLMVLYEFIRCFNPSRIPKAYTWIPNLQKFLSNIYYDFCFNWEKFVKK